MRLCFLFVRRIVRLSLTMEEEQASHYLLALERGYYDALLDEDIEQYGNEVLHNKVRDLLAEWKCYGVPRRVMLYRRLWVLAFRQR